MIYRQDLFKYLKGCFLLIFYKIIQYFLYNSNINLRLHIP